MRRYKKWTVQVVGIFLVMIMSMGGFNYWMDPFNTFHHSHAFNDVQPIINERMQKTNQMTFQPFPYDSLLIGNSRAAYINQNDFQPIKVYNYAVSSIEINEFHGMIEYAKQIRGKPFDTIILALDFNLTRSPAIGQGVERYVNQLQAPMYRWNNALSVDTLKYSIKSFMLSITNEEHTLGKTYNRENVKSSGRLSEKNFQSALKQELVHYQKEVFPTSESYNPEYKEMLQQIKHDNPNTRFVIYTPPLPAPLLDTIIQTNRLNEYERWLRETVEVFDEVHHYTYEHSIARDLRNFNDPDHFNVNIGAMIAHELSDVADPSIPEDFGIVLTKENIDEYVQSIEAAGHL